MKTFFARPAVLWVLFMFNALVALIVPFAVDGAQGIGTAVAMGVVSSGAGSALLTRRRRPLAA